jgi:hypothetical protein
VSGDPSILFNALSNFGAWGVLVAWLIWKDLRADRAKADQQAARIKLEEQQLSYNRERLESDKAMSAALAALTGAIQNKSR